MSASYTERLPDHYGSGSPSDIDDESLVFINPDIEEPEASGSQSSTPETPCHERSQVPRLQVRPRMNIRFHSQPCPAIDSNSNAYEVSSMEPMPSVGRELAALASHTSTTASIDHQDVRLRRSSSTPHIDLRSRYHDPTVPSAILQQQLVEQTKRKVKPRFHGRPTATDLLQPTNERLHDHSGFKWYHPSEAPVQSPTAQSVENAKGTRRAPLKTCLKQKSKSAATTPPYITPEPVTNPNNNSFGTLRRMKTVDFAHEASQKLLSLPPLQPWTAEEIPDIDANAVEAATQTAHQAETHSKPVKRMRSCPGPKTKSGAANPAVTRTDVHVIAVAPSLNIADDPDGDIIDPSTSTPTMQIVESSSGCYEVVWDNVPPEHDVREYRRGSTASVALQSAGSSATKGLERVNTRLTEWTREKDRPTDAFRPQIVVFPDDDGRSRTLDNSIDDEELTVFAPPNSTRPSANPSAHASRLASARVSASDSYNDHETDSQVSDDSPATEKQDPIQESIIVPNTEPTPKRPGHLIGASRGVRKPTEDRRLSNVDESAMKFRGHRDSVTLTRSRIVASGGVSPELFTQKDSVSMAKKRMHARNHAVSSARQISKRAALGMEFAAASPFVSLSRSAPSTPREESAINGIGSEGGAKRLALQPNDNAAHQHIRILE